MEKKTASQMVCRQTDSEYVVTKCLYNLLFQTPYCPPLATLSYTKWCAISSKMADGEIESITERDREGLPGLSQLCNVSLASHRFTGTRHVLQWGTAIILPRVWLPLECRIPMSRSQSTLLDLIQLEDECLHLEEVVQSGCF